MTEPAATTGTQRLPKRIGPYEIVRELGSGGMAQTFEAVRHKPGGFAKRVCIKRVLYPHSADPHFREEFLQEARVLAQLNHVGIVDAYDYDEDDGHWFIVMELVDGVDFARLLDHYARMGRRLPPHVAAYVIARAARALHYLHHFVDSNGVALNIIHRDVSPQNILISRFGYVKLGDLGIASFLGRPKLTQTDHTKGKLHYMSPEHIEKHRGLEARSDLFSLGAVLYEALAGTTPFRQPTQIGTHHAILEGQFEPLLVHAPHLDPELADLVERTLSPNKDERPSSCLELAIALQTLAPHPDPEAALAAGVTETLSEGPAPSPGAVSATYFTGDPLKKALEVASAFRDPAKATSTEPALARTHPQPPFTLPAQRSMLSAAPPTRTTPRVLKWAFALLVVAGLGAAGLWSAVPKRSATTYPAETSTPQRTATIAPATRQQAVVAAATIEPSTAEPAAPETSPSEEPRAATPTAPTQVQTTQNSQDVRDKASRRKENTGALKVRVINWGYVWIDGVFKGKGPVIADKLTPGFHEVGAAQVADKPARIEKVRIPPGGFVEHDIRLNDEMFE